MVFLMFGTLFLWLGQSLVVFDVVFIVVGLPSIVSLFVMVFKIYFWCSDLYAFFYSSRTFADFVSSLFPSLFSHLFAAFIASMVALPFTMFATSGLENVFVRVCYVGLEGYFWSQVCGVSLLELWSLLSSALWFCTCMVV
ncbi:LOW QUALITY PROTEIN: hypothetical protein HID58_059446, partial [Brassica napus]